MSHTVTMSLPEMVDYSLASAEMGKANYNVLHALLHILIKNMSPQQKITVEFTGTDTSDIEHLKNVTQEVPKISTSPKKDRVVYVVETPQVPKTQGKIEMELEQLRHDVDTLKKLPENLNLYQATLDKNEPILEMFQILSITNRVMAAEEGIEKMTLLLEQLIRRINEFEQYMQTVRKIETMVKRLERIEEFLGMNIPPEQDGLFHLEDLPYKDAMMYIQNKFKTIDEMFQKFGRIDDLLTKLDKCAGFDLEAGGANEIFDEMNGLQTAIDSLQRYVEEFLMFMEKYRQDKNDFFCQTHHVLESIDILKITKADLEEVLELLKKKVDVSLFKEKEKMWIAEIAEIHSMLDLKEEIIDFNKYRECNDKKVYSILQKLKALDCLKKLQDNPVTKSKMLGCLDCFSCEKSVVAKKKEGQTSPLPPPPPSPLPGQPIKVYEFDTGLKERICTCTDRLKICGIREHKGEGKKGPVCESRLVGGAHTSFKPDQQRVTHESTFERTFGVKKPEESNVKVLGTDRREYIGKKPSGTPKIICPEQKSSTALQVFGEILQKNTVKRPHTAVKKTQQMMPEKDKTNFDKEAAELLRKQ